MLRKSVGSISAAGPATVQPVELLPIHPSPLPVDPDIRQSTEIWPENRDPAAILSRIRTTGGPGRRPTPRLGALQPGGRVRERSDCMHAPMKYVEKGLSIAANGIWQVYST